MALETIQNLSLDIHKNSLKNLFAKQYDKDTQIVNVTVCDNGKLITNLLDYVYEVKIITPDNKYLKLTGSKYIEAKSNMITILFPGSVFLIPGKVKVEIIILQNQKQLSTMNFNFIVEASLYSDEDILSDEEMISAIEQYKKDFENYTELSRKWAIGGEETFIGILDNIRYYGYSGMPDKWRTESRWLSNKKSPIDCKENDIISFEYEDECKIIEIAFLGKNGEFIDKLVYTNTKSTGNIIVPANTNKCYFGFTIYDDMSYFNPEEVKKIWIKKNNQYYIDVPSITNNSKYYAEESKKSASISTEKATTAVTASADVKKWVVGNNPPTGYISPSDTNNGMYWANQSKSYKEEANNSENKAKQWAIGSYGSEYNGLLKKGKCLGFLNDFAWQYDDYSFYNINYIPCKANDIISVEYGEEGTINSQVSIYFYYSESVSAQKFNSMLDDRGVTTTAPSEFNDLENKIGYFRFEIKPKNDEIVDLQNLDNIYIKINGVPYIESIIPSETNNSKYYAEKAKEYANFAETTIESAKDIVEVTQAEYDALSDEEKNCGYIYDITDAFYEPLQEAYDMITNFAQNYIDLSQQWAIGSTSSTETPSSTNNSMYYSEQAKSYMIEARSFTPTGYLDFVEKLSYCPKIVYSSSEPETTEENDFWYQEYT